MTDNGACYKPHAFAAVCEQLGIKHIRTKPYTPRTNGKAERFIKTALNEWAYARAYNTSHQRAEHLKTWEHIADGSKFWAQNLRSISVKTKTYSQTILSK